MFYSRTVFPVLLQERQSIIKHWLDNLRAKQGEALHNIHFLEGQPISECLSVDFLKALRSMCLICGSGLYVCMYMLSINVHYSCSYGGVSYMSTLTDEVSNSEKESFTYRSFEYLFMLCVSVHCVYMFQFPSWGREAWSSRSSRFMSKGFWDSWWSHGCKRCVKNSHLVSSSTLVQPYGVHFLRKDDVVKNPQNLGYMMSTMICIKTLFLLIENKLFTYWKQGITCLKAFI